MARRPDRTVREPTSTCFFKTKGIWLSYLGMWAGLAVCALIVTIVFWIVTSLLDHDSVSCSPSPCTAFDIFGQALGTLILVVVIIGGVSIISLVVLVPLSIRQCLRWGRLSTRALRTAVYSTILVLPTSLILYALTESQVNNMNPDLQIVVGLTVFALWSFIVICIARWLAMLGSRSTPSQSS
jgi:hypothetical protein